METEAKTKIDEHRQIVGEFAGDPVAVMRAGTRLALDVDRVNVPAPFDLMIVSAGGHPKDINVYQAQKAGGHTTPGMKHGGTIIQVAARRASNRSMPRLRLRRAICRVTRVWE